MRRAGALLVACACVAVFGIPALHGVAQSAPPSGGDNRLATEASCTAPSLVATIAPREIGEPVRSVTLQAAWDAATDTVPAHCRVDGVFAPVDTAPTARPINFRVVLPASWNRRAAQLGGGGINGIIPNLTGGEFGAAGPSLLQRGFATYGSDSGHQMPAFGLRRGGPPPAAARSGLGAQRRSDQEPRLRADEEDARRGDGADRAPVRRAAALQLLHRHVAGRPRRR